MLLQSKYILDRVVFDLRDSHKYFAPSAPIGLSDKTSVVNDVFDFNAFDKYLTPVF